MEDEKKRHTIGLFDIALLLTAVFVVLKACNVIAWAWVWIFAPLWIAGIIAFCFVMLFLFACIIVMAINDSMKD